MPGILIVDDDRTVGDILLSYLRRAELTGTHLSDGQDLDRIITEQDPDLVVLDIMMPGPDGLQLCARIRAQHPALPVILLTARTEEHDRIAGLVAGADDYVSKPFSPRELVLRIQSVLRRSSAVKQPAAPIPDLVDGDLRVSRDSHEVTLGGQAVSLTMREFDLLAHLMTHPGRAFTRDELLEQVWGWNYGDKSTVTVHVRRLREKVETDPAAPTRLVTVWGVGYRWDDTGTAA
jgi:DNA-binding response OmpR family regulator